MGVTILGAISLPTIKLKTVLMLLRLGLVIVSLQILITSAYAQIGFGFGGQLPFGKNKVQRESFKWRYLQSTNFDVYFHQGGDYLARYTAHKAEEALASIQSTLTFTITRRLTIIVYNSHNQFQQTNVISQPLGEGIGGFTELFKNRVVVPFEGDYAKFRHVIHHELGHAVLNDMFYGGSIQSMVNNTARAIIPLWMNEGFCEYEAAGGLDVKTDQFMRDLAVSEYLKGIPQLGGYLAYRGGQSFWWYIAEKYGKGKVGEVFVRFLSSGDLNKTFQSSFGMSLMEMSDQWTKDLKKYYFPDVGRFEHVEDIGSRLTDHRKEGTFYNTSPTLSPDGQKIAYISDDDGEFGIFIQSVDSKEKRRKLIKSGRSADFEELNILTPGLSWDPTGRYLAVGAKATNEDVIYLFDVEDDSYVQKTFGFQTIKGVSWSPDGRYIAFAAAPSAPQSDLYLYDTHTDRLVQVTSDIFSDMEPVWAPDNSALYFISDRGSYLTGDERETNFEIWNHDVSQRDIYKVDLTTRDITRITQSPGVEKTSLVASPDGNIVLYCAAYNGIGNIWQVDLRTKKVAARTNSLQEISQMSLSSDGTKLVFSSQNRVGYDIFLLKFPFDLTIRDTLPTTVFLQMTRDKEGALAKIADKSSPDVEDTLAPVGKFEFDFSNRNIASINEKAATLAPSTSSKSSEAVSADAIDYKVTFTPDVIIANAGYSNWFGAQGVTQMLFSDVLGDHEIYAVLNLFIDLDNSSMFVSYGYYPDVVDYRFALFHNAGFTNLQGTIYRLRNYGGTMSASYPFSRFSRVDWGVQSIVMSRENINAPQEPSLSRFVVVPQASYVYDNTLFGIFAPVAGSRLNFTVEGSPKIGTSGLGFTTLRTDARHYFHLGGLYTIAVRGTGGLSSGSNPQKFFMGGVDNWINPKFSENGWPFVNPEDFAFMRPAWPLRGFGMNERYGSRFFLTNAELRFPLLFALQAGPLPSLFQGLQGQFFFDAGGAFDQDNVSRDLRGVPVTDPILYSTGVGIRTVLFGLPFRIDVAWAHLPTGGFSEPRWHISLGGDF